MRQPFQAPLDELPIRVVAKRADRASRVLEMLMGAAEIAQLAIALAHVEVQRRVQAGHRKRHPSLCYPLVGDQTGGVKRS
ncbi:hypothetical protein SHXM_09360 [Streptomyces hygroscopicus]|nr:hypothetical protein SHXM_09360 [Streptomyces hygroscopicus]